MKSYAKEVQIHWDVLCLTNASLPKMETALPIAPSIVEHSKSFAKDHQAQMDALVLLLAYQSLALMVHAQTIVLLFVHQGRFLANRQHPQMVAHLQIPASQQWSMVVQHFAPLSVHLTTIFALDHWVQMVVKDSQFVFQIPQETVL